MHDAAARRELQEYFRCYVVDQKKVHVMRYDPACRMSCATSPNPPPRSRLAWIASTDARCSASALGYDLNTVEFAVEGGVPYAIDFMNPAPDADLHSVGEENFRVDRRGGRGNGGGGRSRHRSRPSIAGSAS